MKEQSFTTEVGGKTLTATFSDLAEKADGSVIVQYGKTVVLATAVMSDSVVEGLSYFPLKVDYEERFYAAGAILGSRFIRREGRPSDEAILSGRVVDRTIRPLFDQAMRNEVQVIITVLSIDEHDPDTLAVIAASLALSTSDIPWGGPVSAIRIGKTKEGTPVVNPTYLDRTEDRLFYDLLACGRDNTINMVETEAKEVSEDELGNALDQALAELQKLQKFQEDIVSKIGKQKRSVPLRTWREDMQSLFKESFAAKMPGAVISGEPGGKAINALKDEWQKAVSEKFPDISSADAGDYFEEWVNEVIHKEAIENNRRPDGREMDELRPLFAKAGALSPMAHGSGIFYRGGTHVFTALTLGGPGDSQVIDSIEEKDSQKRFMHHYNFPPFSSGETGRMGGINRRAVGHGALAEKSLRAVIPSKEVFPYTIRVVSECMASNGSTSMGSVCASILALMDGGVPILRPVAGIAMGLMLSDSKHKVLTDIQGPEDHHGDMDFKVAGTEKGVTGIQLDIKLDGIPVPILKEALTKAKAARLSILKVITNAIPAPRDHLAPHAPHIAVIKIPVSDIGLVIGPGGKNINGIKDRTKVEEITIEDDGTVFISGGPDAVAGAKAEIEAMTKRYEAGERFTGEVTRITTFGAFVRINGKAEGLVHISEIAPHRIARVEDVLSVGDAVPVIIKEIDEQNRINLSIKAVDPEFAKTHGRGTQGNTDTTNTGGDSGKRE